MDCSAAKSQNEMEDQHVAKLWEFNCIPDHLNPIVNLVEDAEKNPQSKEILEVDIMLVMGSHDLRVPAWAARVYLSGAIRVAQKIVCSGGVGNFTKGVFQRSEAELFQSVMIKAGVPEEIILLEPNSTNTGENVKFSKSLFSTPIETVLLVHKPYMARRSLATCQKIWPDLKSINICTEYVERAEEYAEGFVSMKELIGILVGDTQRVLRYGFPPYDYISPQLPSPGVVEAVEVLAVKYDTHLMPGGL